VEQTSTFKLTNRRDWMTTGVNFINVLLGAFTRADPKSTKKTDDLTVFFALSGSACAKAACRMLMKLTPGVDFKEAFMCLDPKSVKIQSSRLYIFVLLVSAHVNASSKMLMKLTPEHSLYLSVYLSFSLSLYLSLSFFLFN